MPAWEQSNCTSGSANQGFSQCPPNLGQIDYNIAIPRGEKIPLSAFTDFPAYLMMKATLDDPARRWYLSLQYVTIEAANTDGQNETAGNGQERVLTVGKVGYNATVWEGGACAYKNITKWHLSQDRFDFIAAHGNVISGVATKDSTGADAMKGITMAQVYVPNLTLATGAEGEKYMIQFKIGDSNQMRSARTYFTLPEGFDITGVMPRMIDVELSGSIKSGSPAGDYLINAVSGCGGVNLATLYATELSSPSAWIVTNATTGALITITSVAIEGSQFKLLLDTADPDYPTAGNKVSIQLADPTVLSGLGVIGYESNAVQITIG